MHTSISVSLFAVALSVLSIGNDLGATCKPPATCANAPAWKEGAKYKKGDRVIGARGNLWECKGGSAAKLCDDPGYEPDVDSAASDAWKVVDTCFFFDAPELATTDVVVSSAQCPESVTLTALITNDTPFGGVIVPVAFYHSTTRTLIGVTEVEVLPGDVGPTEASIVWTDPLPGSALITVVADDDGTGHGIVRESNETDNASSATLITCTP